MTFKVVGNLIIGGNFKFCLHILLENGVRNKIKTSRATSNLRTWLGRLIDGFMQEKTTRLRICTYESSYVFTQLF